jgi:hypothetical protein
VFAGAIDQILGVAAGIFVFGSAFFGSLLATYTGVLIGRDGDTGLGSCITRLLPIHFGRAGLGSAAALLELLGLPNRARSTRSAYCGRVETVLLIWLSIR